MSLYLVFNSEIHFKNKHNNSYVSVVFSTKLCYPKMYEMSALKRAVVNRIYVRVKAETWKSQVRLAKVSG